MPLSSQTIQSLEIKVNPIKMPFYEFPKSEFCQKLASRGSSCGSCLTPPRLASPSCLAASFDEHLYSKMKAPGCCSHRGGTRQESEAVTDVPIHCTHCQGSSDGILKCVAELRSGGEKKRPISNVIIRIYILLGKEH